MKQCDCRPGPSIQTTALRRRPYKPTRRGSNSREGGGPEDHTLRGPWLLHCDAVGRRTTRVFQGTTVVLGGQYALPVAYLGASRAGVKGHSQVSHVPSHRCRYVSGQEAQPSGLQRC